MFPSPYCYSIDFATPFAIARSTSLISTVSGAARPSPQKPSPSTNKNLQCRILTSEHQRHIFHDGRFSVNLHSLTYQTPLKRRILFPSLYSRR